MDLVAPSNPAGISLGDLKRCGLAHVFLNKFVNLRKFLEYEINEGILFTIKMRFQSVSLALYKPKISIFRALMQRRTSRTGTPTARWSTISWSLECRMRTRMFFIFISFLLSSSYLFQKPSKHHWIEARRRLKRAHRRPLPGECDSRLLRRHQDDTNLKRIATIAPISIPQADPPVPSLCLYILLWTLCANKS
jgi:hypothetical protein